MTVPPQATQVVLSERPVGSITSTTFAVKSTPIPDELAPGDVLVRVDWLSLDPAMRGWLNDTRSYVPPVQIGEKMRAQGLGTVVKGGGSKVRVGDTVSGLVGACLSIPFGGSRQLSLYAVVTRVGQLCDCEREGSSEDLVRAASLSFSVHSLTLRTVSPVHLQVPMNWTFSLLWDIQVRSHTSGRLAHMFNAGDLGFTAYFVPDSITYILSGWLTLFAVRVFSRLGR